MMSGFWIQNRLIPMAAGIGLCLVVGLILAWLLPTWVTKIMPFVFFTGGFMTSSLTPDEIGKDETGNNIFVLLAGAWLSYIFFSPHLFSGISTISQWFFQVMGFNIINGFSILAGALLASRLQKNHF